MDKKEYIERGLAVQLLRECTRIQGKEIEKECDTPILRNVLNVYYLARDGATTLLEDIPAADVVEVVHASWINCNSGNATCSHCLIRSLGVYDDDNEQHFCGHCGAKMDGGNRNADA